jgi:signal transduction histidine kinase
MLRPAHPQTAAANAVLIVEDDELTAELEQRALLRDGRQSVIAASIQHALELIDERHFAAILLDYHLPDADPWAVVEAAGSKAPPIPVIVVTGQGSEIIASEAIKRGVADYVRKSGSFWDELPGILVRVIEAAAVRERLRLSEANCRLMAEVADKANKAKGDFLARMSHEIRTPLTSIIGLGYLLDKTPLSEDQREYVARVQVAGRVLLGLVNNVLDLSKIDAGEMLLSHESFDLAEPLRSSHQMLGPQAQVKGIELVMSTGTVLPCKVTGDPSRLLQILLNLVSNAIKFTIAGRVEVSTICTPLGNRRVLMRCEVKDTGVGIESEALERLFKPFNQAHSTTARRFGGTGLGLSIARSLVELMGGSIGVASEVAVGSTFWFEVPLEMAAGNAGGHMPGLGGGDRRARWLEGVRVLAVDDCEIVLRVVRRILEEQGAIVACCSDGASALEFVRAHRPEIDVVLIDVQMPILDGNETTRRIRRELGDKTLPIIGLTADALLSERERSLAAGMNEIITKPFDPRTMLGEIRLIVEQAQIARRDSRPAPEDTPEGVRARPSRRSI